MNQEEQKWTSDKVKYWFSITTLVDRALVSRFPRVDGWDGWACDLGNFISWLKKEENLIIIKHICSEIKTVFQ